LTTSVSSASGCRASSTPTTTIVIAGNPAASRALGLAAPSSGSPARLRMRRDTSSAVFPDASSARSMLPSTGTVRGGGSVTKVRCSRLDSATAR
jgi:hypothetical protein